MMRSALPILAIALLPFPIASAQASQEVETILPSGSTLSITGRTNDGMDVSFDGELVLGGRLLAYWEATYLGGDTLADAQVERVMNLRFYPDDDARAQLPRFSSPADDGEAADRLFLYRDRADGAFRTGYDPSHDRAIDLVLDGFEDVPAGFLEHREGFVVQPATVTLSGLESVLEGNDRFLYAKLEDVEALPRTQDSIERIPDSDPNRFVGMPWLETFLAGEAMVLRSTPSDQGAEVMAVPPGTAVEKIATAADGWANVLVRDESGAETVRGFVPAGELLIVN